METPQYHCHNLGTFKVKYFRRITYKENKKFNIQASTNKAKGGGYEY